jgi:predicted phage terminase large subunit-like protein
MKPLKAAPRKIKPAQRAHLEEKGLLPRTREESETLQRDMDAQLSMLLRQKAVISASEKFMPFVKYTSPDPEDPNDITRSRYKNAKHHDAIARVLEEVEKGEIKQLILTMPPRHGKSELTTRRFPAWYVGRNSRQNVVVATYSDEFAQDFGREVRGIMQSQQYKQIFPHVKLMRGSAAADRLQTIDGGMLTFVGRGGALTGRGAHCLIIDDLIKDDKEASSQAVRDQAWNWFTKVAMTRRMGKKLVIVIMTRWHSDDIIGRLTDPENPSYNHIEAQKWKIINLPALAEDDDPLGRAPGQALWPDGPDQFDEEFLQSQQRLDPLGFSALYQQRPSAADGVLFKREHIKWYDPKDLPPDLRMYCASDHAISEKERRDYTVLLAAGVDKQSRLYLTDCYWQRAAPDKVVEAMLQMASMRKPLLWWAGRDHITKSIGPFLRKRMVETQVFFNLVEVTPSGDKESRAQSIAARLSMDLVYFPKGATWAEKAVEELMRFPNGTHDDFVDAFALFGLGLQSQFAAAPARQKTDIPKYGTLGWVKYWDKKQRQHESLAQRGGW